MSTISNDGLFAIGPRQMEVWPSGQNLGVLDESIRETVFTDIDEYHPALIRRVLEFEEEKWGDDRPDSRVLGGRKIHHIDQWGIPEADFINARAEEVFRRTLHSTTAHIDLCWANVYRQHDYVGPHSHRLSVASVVYCLDSGDPDPNDPLSGRLFFADPRLGICCNEQPGFMTTPYYPQLVPGTMLIWPSEVVHCVTPYVGKRPRITLAWNLSRRQGELGQPSELEGVSISPTDRA